MDVNPETFGFMTQELDRLRARVAELEASNDRLRQDRLDYSSVTTTEGLNASEWIWRTGKAERRIKELETKLASIQKYAVDRKMKTLEKLAAE